MKQTAVEWLIEQMRQPNWMSIPTTEWIQQAKEMEKQQIIDAYCMGDDNIGAEEYYNETFKSE